jgi:hypothetical protein
MLMVKSFLCALLREMKPGITIMNQNPKDNSWDGDTLALVVYNVHLKITQFGLAY